MQIQRKSYIFFELGMKTSYCYCPTYSSTNGPHGTGIGSESRDPECEYVAVDSSTVVPGEDGGHGHGCRTAAARERGVKGLSSRTTTKGRRAAGCVVTVPPPPPQLSNLRSPHC